MNRTILEAMPASELLAGLAEEASELAQAALKLRRAMTQINPTPVTKDEAYNGLCEEVADVLLYLELISPDRARVRDTIARKKERWAERLEASWDTETVDDFWEDV